MRPVEPTIRESTPLVVTTQPRRYRRPSAARRAQAQEAIEGPVGHTHSVMPLVLVGVQTVATCSAASASFTLGLHNPHRRLAPEAAWLGAGLVALGVFTQSVQLGVSFGRRADSLTAVAALSGSAMAVLCASAYLLRNAHVAGAEAHEGAAACLMGLGWLSHAAATTAQLHRDEMAWGTTPKPRWLRNIAGSSACLASVAAVLGIGGVACATWPASAAMPHPAALGGALLALSIIPWAFASTGALHAMGSTV